jgi:hypothetical protein
MAQHYRHFWGPQVSQKFNFQWDIIRHDSFVVITACEGPGYDVGPAPQRIVGEAFFQVASVCPHDGGVTFWVLMGSHTGGSYGVGFTTWRETLNLWTDITVFDASDNWGQN